MNPKSKGSFNLTFYSYADTSLTIMDDGLVDRTRSGHVETLFTEIKFTLFGFNHNLYKQYIPIGASTTTIDLPNGDVSANMNEFILLQGFSNSLLSTSQFNFFVYLPMRLMILIVEINILNIDTSSY